MVSLTLSGVPFWLDLFKMFTSLKWPFIQTLKICSKYVMQVILNLMILVVNNGLENESVKVINKCKWNYLNELNLNKNEIADDSIDCLSSANFP